MHKFTSKIIRLGLCSFLILFCFSFTAEAKTTVKQLAVPFHRQQHALSCEAASLTMALNYKGVKVTENKLISQMVFATYLPREAGNIWGDPQEGFVGNINGSMPNKGYGVYEQPIASLAQKYRQAEPIINGSLDQLITALNDKNPVIVWGVTGKGTDISWQTPAGYQIPARMGEHTRVLVGYTGKADNPQHLILLDPIYGRLKWPVAYFLKNWATLDNRAVVVY